MNKEMMNEAVEAVSEDVASVEETTSLTEGNDANEADELSALRAELAEKESALADLMAQQERYAAEFAEFRREFSEVPLGKVSDEVWDQVRAGVPLAAAYALAEHRAAKQAGTSYRETYAWHSLSGGTDEGLFSPAEVRAMSQGEVRLHYDRIVESMKRW